MILTTHVTHMHLRGFIDLKHLVHNASGTFCKHLLKLETVTTRVCMYCDKNDLRRLLSK